MIEVVDEYARTLGYGIFILIAFFIVMYIVQKLIDFKEWVCDIYYHLHRKWKRWIIK